MFQGVRAVRWSRQLQGALRNVFIVSCWLMVPGFLKLWNILIGCFSCYSLFPQFLCCLLCEWSFCFVFWQSQFSNWSFKSAAFYLKIMNICSSSSPFCDILSEILHFASLEQFENVSLRHRERASRAPAVWVIAWFVSSQHFLSFPSTERKILFTLPGIE